MKYVIPLVLLLTLFSCDSRKDKFCGKLMSSAEIESLRTTYNKPFQYTQADFDLMDKIDRDVHDLFHDSIMVDIVPFVHDKNQIGFYISIPADSLAINTLCCHLLNKAYAEMPDHRILLVYERYRNECICAVERRP